MSQPVNDTDHYVVAMRLIAQVITRYKEARYNLALAEEALRVAEVAMDLAPGARGALAAIDAAGEKP